MQTVAAEKYWTDCLKLCLETTECVLVVELESSCNLYNKLNIFNVTLLEKDSGKRVGFKRTMDSCPNGGEPPLFGNSLVNESTYTLSLVSSDDGQNIIQFGKRCMEGSILSVRGDVSVCITPRLFPDPFRGNYALAEELCSTDNGLGLAGIYSDDEEFNIRVQWNITWKKTPTKKEEIDSLTNDAWINGVCGDFNSAECYNTDSLVEPTYEPLLKGVYGSDTIFCAFLSPLEPGIRRCGCNLNTTHETTALMRGAVCLTKPL